VESGIPIIVDGKLIDAGNDSTRPTVRAARSIFAIFATWRDLHSERDSKVESRQDATHAKSRYSMSDAQLLTASSFDRVSTWRSPPYGNRRDRRGCVAICYLVDLEDNAPSHARRR